MRWLSIVAALLIGSCSRTEPVALPPADTYRIESFPLHVGDSTESVTTALVTNSFFGQTGGQPKLGRLFLPEESSAAMTRVVILSDALWKRRFGANPAVIGQTVQLGGQNFTIVGIMPERFTVPPDVNVWTPM